MSINRRRRAVLTAPLNIVAVAVSGGVFTGKTWPRAVRTEMTALQADSSRQQPITVSPLIRVHRNPEAPYVDR